MNIKNYFLLILIIAASFISFAETVKGSVKADILDLINEPIAFATVAILNSSDSSLIKAASSNEDGVVYLIILTKVIICFQFHTLAIRKNILVTLF
jgi:hypothetical protein